jgi:hypothetical protein
MQEPARVPRQFARLADADEARWTEAPVTLASEPPISEMPSTTAAIDLQIEPAPVGIFAGATRALNH